MILTDRLKTIAALVPHGSNIVDIGTDHGLLPVFLVKNGICNRALATDISRDSLKKAQDLIKNYGLEQRIETRVGSGLHAIVPGEVSTAIIAGMGGLLIQSILEDNPETAQSISTFILQPMTAQDRLRKWLVEHEYEIIDEELVREDDRFYEIIVAAHGKGGNLQPIHYEIGIKLIEKRHPLLLPFLQKRIESMREMVMHLEAKGTMNALNRRNELKDKIYQYEEVYRWIVAAK